MIGTRLVALEAIGEDRFLRAMAESLSKYGAGVGIIIFVIGWPLTSENAGNMDAGRGEYSGWRQRTCSEEMGEKAGTNRSMSKIVLHGKKFVLSAIFGIGKFHLSPLHIF